MARRKTHEEYCKEIYTIFKEEVTIIGKYINSNTKIEVQHHCGYKWNVLPLLLKRAKSCPNCAGVKPKNLEMFKREVYQNYQDEYVVLGNYVNVMTKTLLKHNICGNEFEMSPDNFLHNHQCPICMHEQRKNKLKHDFNIVKLNIESVQGYKLLSTEYKNKIEKLDLQCPNNHEFKMNYNDFIYCENRCPICFKNDGIGYNVKTFAEVQKLFEVEGYQLLTNNYTNGTMPLEYICPNGHNGIMTYYEFKRRNGCPECNLPRGEEKIINYLRKNNIKFQTPYKFIDCKNVNQLSFDFAIFNDNNNLLFLIEYQGIQHYKPSGYFGGEDKFKCQLINDDIKRQYCLDNNITLIEIPYTKLRCIENILITLFE